MKRATITIPDDLEEALVVYGQAHGLADALDALVGGALRDLLELHGYLPPFRPLRITPLHRDDGPTDVSLNHDRYFAGGETGGPR